MNLNSVDSCIKIVNSKGVDHDLLVCANVNVTVSVNGINMELIATVVMSPTVVMIATMAAQGKSLYLFLFLLAAYNMATAFAAMCTHVGSHPNRSCIKQLQTSCTCESHEEETGVTLMQGVSPSATTLHPDFYVVEPPGFEALNTDPANKQYSRNPDGGTDESRWACMDIAGEPKGRCYNNYGRQFDKGWTWEEAKTMCEGKGDTIWGVKATLAMIGSDKDRGALYSETGSRGFGDDPNYDPDEVTWIGMRNNGATGNVWKLDAIMDDGSRGYRNDGPYSTDWLLGKTCGTQCYNYAKVESWTGCLAYDIVGTGANWMRNHDCNLKRHAMCMRYYNPYPLKCKRIECEFHRPANVEVAATVTAHGRFVGSRGLRESYWEVVGCKDTYVISKKEHLLPSGKTKACPNADEWNAGDTSPKVWGKQDDDWESGNKPECKEIKCDLVDSNGVAWDKTDGMAWDKAHTDACQTCPIGCTAGKRCYVKCQSNYGFSEATKTAFSLGSDTNKAETSSCPGTSELVDWNHDKRKLEWKQGAPYGNCHLQN